MESTQDLRGGGHALVVGGTGMLRDAVLNLARRGFTVSVIARRAGRLADLAKAAADCPGTINAIAGDYCDTPALASALAEAVRRHGPVTTAVVWIHSSAPDALRVVAEAVGSAEAPCLYFHVRGSAAADPSSPAPNGMDRFRELPNLRYHEVILGFRIGPSGARWLTDAEISQGVLDAMQRGAARTVVGVVEPWEQRP